MSKYSRILVAGTALLALYSIMGGCRSSQKYTVPGMNKNSFAGYSLKKSPSGQLIISQADDSEPLFSEPAEDSYQGSYQDKNVNVIVKPRTKRKVLTDIAAKIEAGKEYQEARAGTKAIIRPDESWRIIPEITGAIATKPYSDGRSAQLDQLVAGIRAGAYQPMRIGDFIDGFAKDLQLYLEGGAHIMGGKYNGRLDEEHYAALARIGIGLFSQEAGTYLKAMLAAGPGRFSIDLTDEDRERLGLDSNTISDSLVRAIIDVQARQDIWKGIYAKGRFNVSVQNRENWDNYRAIASELGIGLRGEFPGVFERWYMEALATYRDELDQYFNNTSANRNIFGGRIGAGAQIGRNSVVELALEYDEELLLSLILQWLVRL